MLKRFLKYNKITAKEVAEKTGYSKNTLTNWNKYPDDSKIPQEFILCLLKHYPKADLKKFFPVHNKIIKAAELNNKNKAQTRNNF